MLRRNLGAKATAGMGLGRVKTQACCGAVEWRSQASDVLSVSREARLLAPSDAEARKLGGSYASGARDSRLAFVLLCLSRVDLAAVLE